MKSVAVGSPQKLTLYREIKTDTAPSLEKYIHWLLDSKRAANGEFFNVTETELDEAIDGAVSFLAESQPLMQESKKLQRRRPSAQILESSETLLSLHRLLRDAERQAFLLQQRIVTLRSRLQVAIGENLGIKGIALWPWREQWRLDEESLKREHPQLCEQYKKLFASRVFQLE